MISLSRWVSRAGARFALALVAVTALSAFALATHTANVRRSAVIRVDGAPAPRITSVGRVRFIASPGAPEQIVPDTGAPPDGLAVRLLWLAGRSASQTREGSVVLDPAGGVVRFDESLTAHRVKVLAAARTITDVAPAPDGGLWLADDAGRVFRIDEHGRIISDVAAPFSYAALGADRIGGRVWLVRSPERFSYAWDSSATAVVATLGVNGTLERELGRATIPPHVMLQDLANAGRIVVSGDRIFYAPFIRDQIVAMNTRGDTLWVASRDLPQTTSAPRFEVQKGKVVVNYHAVNLGMALGPDGRLYVLSTPGFTTLRSRLDAFEPATGRLLRTVELNTAQPTIGVDDSGRVYLWDATKLLTGAAALEREPIGHATLSMRQGTRVDTDSLRGHVTLVNYWASWCTICRTELPALDSMRRAWSNGEAVFLSVNADASPVLADRFLRSTGLAFDYAVGGPKAGALVHAPGLPFTVLLDREGRIVQHWAGYTGREQMNEIDAALRLELQAGRPEEHHMHH